MHTIICLVFNKYGFFEALYAIYLYTSYDCQIVRCYYNIQNYS